MSEEQRRRVAEQHRQAAAAARAAHEAARTRHQAAVELGNAPRQQRLDAAAARQQAVLDWMNAGRTALGQSITGLGMLPGVVKSKTPLSFGVNRLAGGADVQIPQGMPQMPEQVAAPPREYHGPAYGTGQYAQGHPQGMVDSGASLARQDVPIQLGGVVTPESGEPDVLSQMQAYLANDPRTRALPEGDFRAEEDRLRRLAAVEAIQNKAIPGTGSVRFRGHRMSQDQYYGVPEGTHGGIVRDGVPMRLGQYGGAAFTPEEQEARASARSYLNSNLRMAETPSVLPSAVAELMQQEIAGRSQKDVTEARKREADAEQTAVLMNYMSQLTPEMVDANPVQNLFLAERLGGEDAVRALISNLSSETIADLDERQIDALGPTAREELRNRKLFDPIKPQGGTLEWLMQNALLTPVGPP